MEALQPPRHELWATFSVKDHCRRGAFIAEALLYDKLLIPVVPKHEDGISKEEADREWQRWKTNKWSPTRQTEILRILKDRAEPIAWTAARQAEWRAAMRKSFADARRDGYFQTGSVLQRFAPAMARTVVAVSPVYSLAELKTVSHVQRVKKRKAVSANALLAVLGQELLVPSLRDGGYVKALETAVSIAGKDEYRGCRQALHEWHQKFVTSDSMTDADSIKEAVEEMKRLVNKLNTATKQQKKWRSLKQVFSFFTTAFKFATPVAPIAASTGSAFASLGTFAVEQIALETIGNDVGMQAATMILAARERLGIE